MKVRVINLPQREDRRNWFEQRNKDVLQNLDWSFAEAINGSRLTYEVLQGMGFDTDKNWRDPLLKRTLTKGEVGCFLSHYKLWEECADGDEPYLILEDDVFLNEEPQEPWLDGDLTYLTHKEMLPEGVVGNRVCYAYWCAAYILTPHAARTLLDTDIDENIIPVDEYVPRMTDRLVMTAVDKAGQTPRKELGTNIEPQSHKSFLIDFNVHNLTCHNNDERAVKLLETNPDVVNILDEEWKGGTMEGPGGGQKLNCLRRYINGLPDHDVVIFTDGFDVFWTRDVDEVVGRWLDMKSEVVFAAEKHLWPNKHLRFPPSHTQYRYLNSGCFIGRVGELKRILADSAPRQCATTNCTCNIGSSVVSTAWCWTTSSTFSLPTVTRSQSKTSRSTTQQLAATVVSTTEMVVPVRRRSSTACTMPSFPKRSTSNLTVKDYEVIGNEMLLVDFLTPAQCEEWIRIGE